MIYILSWITKKHQNILSRSLHSKLKKIQGLFKDLNRNLKTFQGLPLKFKDFSSANPEELMNVNQGSDCWVRLRPHAGGFFQKCLF